MSARLSFGGHNAPTRGRRTFGDFLRAADAEWEAKTPAEREAAVDEYYASEEFARAWAYQHSEERVRDEARARVERALRERNRRTPATQMSTGAHPATARSRERRDSGSRQTVASGDDSDPGEPPPLAAAPTLTAQARMILGDRPGLVELRAIHPRLKTVKQRWFGGDQLDGLERTARTLSQGYDVWIGAARRDRRGGERVDVAPSVTVWADCDTPLAAAALELFRPAPTLIVRTSAGRLQGWWRVDRPLGVDDLESTLRRLAAALGSDTACCDAPRIMRALGTRNLKRGTPEPIEAVRWTGEVVALDDLLAALPDKVVNAIDQRNGEPWRAPAELVPVGKRYEAVRGLIGLLSDRGIREPALMAMAAAFLEHGVVHDPAHPIDLEPVRAIVRDFAKADREARDGYVALWGGHGLRRART